MSETMPGVVVSKSSINRAILLVFVSLIAFSSEYVRRSSGQQFAAEQVYGGCPNGCSGHGRCNDYGICDCFEGFINGDCSERQCPVGKAWAQPAPLNEVVHTPQECSNKGACDRSTGQCICDPGFEGHACERLACPQQCNGHGYCATLEDYSRLDVVSRELLDRSAQQYIYDRIWDHDMIVGCVCDKGYTGYDCSRRLCAAGDDPLTTGQAYEVQLVTCASKYPVQTVTLFHSAPYLTSGTFVLRFGSAWTSPLPFNVAGSAMQPSLAALPGATTVTVTASPSAPVPGQPSVQAYSWAVSFANANLQHYPLVPGWRVNEVQSFTCVANGGNFAAMFDGILIAVDIPYDISSNSLRQLLKTHPFIVDVSVTYSDAVTDHACTAAGNTVTINFLQTVITGDNTGGDLPPLLFDPTDRDRVTVTGQPLLLQLSQGPRTSPYLDAIAVENVKGVDTCRVPEIQQFQCKATSGLFSIAFVGPQGSHAVQNIPFDSSSSNLEQALMGIPEFAKVKVTITSGGNTICSAIGSTVQVEFTWSTYLGPTSNGDLPALTLDTTNGGQNGLGWIGVGVGPTLTATATEIRKGVACAALDASFPSNPFNQMTTIVDTSVGGGSFRVAFRGSTSDPLPATISDPTNAKAILEKLGPVDTVKVSFSGSALCQTPANVMAITFLQNFGNLPTISVDSSAMSAGSSVQVYSSGATVGGITSSDGARENNPCSDRGLCDEFSGDCSCFENFYPTSDGNGNVGNSFTTRSDCGAFTSNFTGACPGDFPCSGHGSCSGSPSYRCQCDDTWMGGDCSERRCPMDGSWFSYPTGAHQLHRIEKECSDRGSCDRVLGKCQCDTAFEGEACERMSCPGEPLCSGHGVCIPNSELATRATIKGEVAGFTYGNDNANPWTWDADMIQACWCDSGYVGHDCSLRECPRGDDPNTYSDSIEIQLVQCIADAGTFMLTLRDQSSAPIAFDAPLSQVQSAFASLPTIEGGRVTFSTGNTACSTNGANIIAFEFGLVFGDLPSLRVETSGTLFNGVDANGDPVPATVNMAIGGQVLGGVNSVKGTRENAVCSNHGVCDYLTGTCSCFEEFASSDGMGGPGDRGDCGYHYTRKLADS